ncbi:hypothetical protein PMG71_09585 [Roseofilum sp. BLCC_M154]|uniref:Uncharacterized protein n=1 Tax=Roseofilum acuticapitatum BLCC-M154 TaxID=3022444 RepID=A0ABT7ARZ5_9CYAN|nr:hypothetical protein [Roseofilum acuticapitatum]MDJ1169677.1 hypothetical protein [Roseofilum acuticapitatum BLCC-M154]
MTHQRNTQGLKRNFSKWKSSNETKAIRVPEHLADRVLAYAHSLDEGITEPGTGKTQKEAIAILRQALDLKANAGGKIKAEIKKALSLLEN